MVEKLTIEKLDNLYNILSGWQYEGAGQIHYKEKLTQAEADDLIIIMKYKPRY